MDIKGAIGRVAFIQSRSCENPQREGRKIKSNEISMDATSELDSFSRLTKTIKKKKKRKTFMCRTDGTFT